MPLSIFHTIIVVYQDYGKLNETLIVLLEPKDNTAVQLSIYADIESPSHNSFKKFKKRKEEKSKEEKSKAKYTKEKKEKKEKVQINTWQHESQSQHSK